MDLAIMQPYFFPYIGYFQLLNTVDEFILYDNIEFTKKGWINRNRILVNGDEAFITLPLKKDSDFLHVKDRSLADSWEQDRRKLANRIVESYRKSPYFEQAFPVIEECILFENRNLFSFIFNSIEMIRSYLGISSKLIISSSLPIDHTLKGEDKVLSICEYKKADSYINPIGGVELYSADTFREQGIDLKFLRSNTIEYPQFNNKFVPWLSIVDVMMFNDKKSIASYLSNFSLQ
ncbi:MAG: hypothetical protein EOO43_09990 [Flavobacterium sp.]|nr:MAG: hypothetical protein EOO43_09990 [Flavobacterium sp.]